MQILSFGQKLILSTWMDESYIEHYRFAASIARGSGQASVKNFKTIYAVATNKSET